MKVSDQIAVGAARLVGGLVALGFAIRVFGEISGKYHYTFSAEEVELFRWILCALGGVSITGGAAAGIRAWHAHSSRLIEEGDDNAVEITEDQGDDSNK